MSLMRPLHRRRIALPMAVLLALLAAGLAWGQRRGRNSFFPEISSDFPKQAEFHFLRVEYQDMYGIRGGFGGFGRGWWMQDWPEADLHFSQGLRRLTRLDVGEWRHVPLTDDRVYEYPWIYATQVGYWNLNNAETARLRDYLERGGFLMTDDFHGPDEWEVFAETMERVFPGQPIDDLDQSHPMLHVLYDINERTFIPGLRHLGIGPGGRVYARPEYTPPYWRAMYDSKGRLVVAVNYNQDVGDAWEHADLPQYPEDMTRLAYYFGINYLIYSLTH
jgi:hypothetical protein